MKTWFFEKIIKIDKTLTKLTERWKEKIQIRKIQDEKEGITADTKKIQRI